ncbi:MAG: hypothetical protein KJ558_10180 [Gammaproteobacteria bacterium]|nr:hypothetical protein [Gammaproteobacteria bacterium]MBU1655174.1 hypothetical protein [Gammaproteobacteria bacterium]MBU1959985.1 hypothetical protein [Gammaproteobacteria bacterium]
MRENTFVQIFPAIVLLAILAATTGCTEATLSRRDMGMIAGSIAGGIVGNQLGEGSGRTAMIIAGTMAGAYAGGQLGRAMDERDQFRTRLALEQNRSMQPTSWSNPDNGNSYTVVPTRTYEGRSGPCRDYTTKAFVGGRSEVIHGTACRSPDGSWRTNG